MLEEKDIKGDPTAIAVHLCEKMDGLRNKKLEEDEMKILVSLLLGAKDEKVADGMFEDITAKSWALKAVSARQKAVFGNELVDKTTLIMLDVISKDNIGTMLMYLYYIQWKAFTKGWEKVTITTFCEELFPFGSISEENLHTLWDATKVKTERSLNNLIDYTFCTKSFNKNIV